MRGVDLHQLCAVCVTMVLAVGVIGCHSSDPLQQPIGGGAEPGEQRVGPDGQTLVWVPGGSFMMGSEDGEDYEGPVHRVTLSGFWIGQCEVSNAQYRAFCNATRRQFPPDSSRGNDHPVVSVSWEDAKAYCDFYGYSLPTEAQWEYAAGGAESLIYPWGDEWIPENLCWRGNPGPDTDTFPVGSFPAGVSWCSALDMAGNLWEWCADWWAYDYYQVSPELNPTGPENGEARALRGGSWDNVSYYCRCSCRSNPARPLAWYNYGFRVSRSVR